MNWQMNDASKLKRVLIMGSKSSHCVADLLHRGHESEIEAQKQARFDSISMRIKKCLFQRQCVTNTAARLLISIILFYRRLQVATPISVQRSAVSN
jgi:formyltetrahydrofolate hydrolase